MDIHFREARAEDLRVIVGMLADDPLGAQREKATDPLPSSYHEAFEAIHDDPHDRILVAVDDGEIAGFLQLTFTPSLTYQGGWRATIEGVRTRTDLRGKGVGAALIRQAIALARARPCHLIQLTTDKQRPEALRFYERLGFIASHEGMKLRL